MRDFIERLRAKPEHVRRRIAIGTTAGITGVVTAAWFFTLLFAGTLSLAIPPSGTSDATLAQANTNGGTSVDINTDKNGGNSAAIAGVGASNFSKLLAAVGFSVGKKAVPALKVEDVRPTPTPSQQPTTIPF